MSQRQVEDTCPVCFSFCLHYCDVIMGSIASNHQPHECLLNRSFGHRSKKTSKLRVTGLCVGNSPETGEFPAQMVSNAENVSIRWRHHVSTSLKLPVYGSARSHWNYLCTTLFNLNDLFIEFSSYFYLPLCRNCVSLHAMEQSCTSISCDMVFQCRGSVPVSFC